ncbi:tyrosine--tRNA ligase [Candidatus Saccharibacteria bacterium]|nr:tyrosine--tRNA ligase [Candidatus Saccharibacteria bacterium]
MTLSEELKWRGFVNQTTLSDINRLDNNNWIFYHGFDASADSQTVGNLAAMMLDKVFLRHGHKGILLAGGATSLIGDPGGKDAERILQSEETVAKNVESAKQQIESIFQGYEITLVNNLDWFKDMTVIEFLRDVGKNFSMTPLVQRDYIAKRMGEGGSGISYTEFSYTLLQGYDFLHLHQKFGVNLQLSGSDQWGNCISGVDLVRRETGDEVNALTMPLIINKTTGKKFGKSEDGAVWLDPKKTSPYKFYQFWLNVDDEGIEGYLKVYTELEKSKIEQVMQEFDDDKSSRSAQRILAYEVTSLVHGKQAADSVANITDVLFGDKDYTDISADNIVQLKSELPLSESSIGEPVINALVEAGLAESNSQARRFIEQNAVYVNGNPINLDYRFSKDDLIDGKHAVLRRGKNSNAIVQIKN